jgi:hypothetical protein
MNGRPALDVAIDLFRRPTAVKEYQTARLPGDVLTVIRIAAGGEVDTGRFGLDHEKRVRAIHEACVFYVQQVLFHPKADAHRLLGLVPGATPADIQMHKRMLLKWLHPDRNPSKWQQALFQRVVDAARKLEDGQGVDIPDVIPPHTPVRHSRRQRNQMARFAAQRVRKPVGWRQRIIKHLKRWSLVGGGGLVLYFAWDMAFSQNADGTNGWLRTMLFDLFKW